jgi:hypothetical protein
MDKLMAMMKKNAMFYKATELGFEMFFKMIFYDLKVYEWVMSSRMAWKWMETWAKENRM